MTDDELTKLELLSVQATDGPWDTGWEQGEIVIRSDATHETVCIVGDEMDQTEHDSAFVAASREAVPALVAEVRRLRKALDAIQRVSPGHTTVYALADEALKGAQK